MQTQEQPTMERDWVDPPKPRKGDRRAHKGSADTTTGLLAFAAALVVIPAMIGLALVVYLAWPR